jgi:hypothetical protein
MPATRFVSATSLCLRLIAAIPGGYALTATAVAALGGLLPMTGMARSEAVTLSTMSGFVLYLVLLIWAFAERRLARLWGGIVGGLAVCAGVLWLLPRIGVAGA